MNLENKEASVQETREKLFKMAHEFAFSPDKNTKVLRGEKLMKAALIYAFSVCFQSQKEETIEKVPRLRLITDDEE